MKQFLKASLLVTIASLLAVGFAVSAKEKKPKKQDPRAQLDAQPDPVWPPPPDEPRVKWVRFIRDEYDVGAVKKSPLLDALAGKREDFVSLKRPMMAVGDADGSVYVLDVVKGLLKFDFAQKKLLNFSQIGKFKAQNGVALAVDSQFVYVSDSKGGKVAVFDKEGRFLRFLAGEKGIEWPIGLAVDEKAGLIFVVSGKKHCVLVLERSSGKLVRTIGRQGVEPGQFNFPTYLTLLPGDRIAVVDTTNWRVQILNYSGKVLKVFGSIGDKPGQFSRPKGIASDSDGNLYIVDGSFNNIQIFSQEGRLLSFLGSFGDAKGQFHTPLGLSCHDDTFYIADQLNGRVQVLKYLPEVSNGKGKVEAN